MQNAATPLDTLIHLLSKLPGLGQRSARRAVLHLFKNKESLMLPLAKALLEAAEKVKICETCGNLDLANPCHICTDAKRDATSLCVVEEVADVWALERGSIYKGRYHVLGGVLSAMDGVGPDNLNIAALMRRVQEGGIAEIILATNATMDGQTTAHYVADRLQPLGVKVSRLAHGIPVGGELDYLDEGTLSAALKARKVV
jgi:recombination protein RecR